MSYRHPARATDLRVLRRGDVFVARLAGCNLAVPLLLNYVAVDHPFDRGVALPLVLYGSPLSGGIEARSPHRPPWWKLSLDVADLAALRAAPPEARVCLGVELPNGDSAGLAPCDIVEVVGWPP